MAMPWANILCPYQGVLVFLSSIHQSIYIINFESISNLISITFEIGIIVGLVLILWVSACVYLAKATSYHS